MAGSTDESDVAIATRAERLAKLARVDSAVQLYDTLVARIFAEQTHNSAFGLQVRYRLARFLELNQRNVRALEVATQLAEDAAAAAAYDVEVRARLLRALIFEVAENGPLCRVALDRARETLEAAALDSLRSEYLIRASSYERFFGDPEQALAYARQALQVAERHGRFDDVGTAHFLIAALQPELPTTQRLYHLRADARAQRRHGDELASALALINVASVLDAAGRLGAAIAAMDSARTQLADMLDNGYADLRYAYTVDRELANMLRRDGRLPEAYDVLARAYRLETEYAYGQTAADVLAAEERLRDESRAEALSTQTRLLESERRLRYVFQGGILVAMLLLAVLALYVRRLSRAQAALREESERQLTLRAEIHHRVKNNFQTVISLLELQAERVRDEESAERFRSMAARLHGLAAVHEELDQAATQGAYTLEAYVHNLVQQLRSLAPPGPPPVFDLSIPPVEWPVKAVATLGMLLNELIANSFKHASPGDQALRIAIAITQDGSRVELRYRDNGQPSIAIDPAGESHHEGAGLGQAVIRSLVRQLRGELALERDGETAVTFPLPAPPSPPPD